LRHGSGTARLLSRAQGLDDRAEPGPAGRQADRGRSIVCRSRTDQAGQTALDPRTNEPAGPVAAPRQHPGPGRDNLRPAQVRERDAVARRFRPEDAAGAERLPGALVHWVDASRVADRDRRRFSNPDGALPAARAAAPAAPAHAFARQGDLLGRRDGLLPRQRAARSHRRHRPAAPRPAPPAAHGAAIPATPSRSAPVYCPVDTSAH